jgi:hypothetical protein
MRFQVFGDRFSLSAQDVRARGPVRLVSFLLALMVPLGAMSCLSDATSSGDEGGGTGVRKALYGRFVVNLVEGTSFSDPFASVAGRVSDGPTPSVLAWDTTATSGACKLLVPRTPFCANSCGSAGACVDSAGVGVCRAYPKGVNVGTVTLTGLRTVSGSTSVTMTPLLLNYQPTAGTSFQFPPFTEEQSVTLAATGDTSGAFTLTAKAIKPLVPLFDSVVLQSGQPMTLQWTPKGSAATSSIHAEVDISHHGGLKGLIACEASDNGELVIAATLVDQLKALGIAGFPTVDMTRYASGTNANTNVELRVESRITRPISIPGLVSCFGDDECPNGKTCQQDFKCQ